MSRIGDLPINLPKNVNMDLSGDLLKIKGPLGEMSYSILPGISVKKSENKIIVTRDNDTLKAKHGLSRALINNMVVGVSGGFSKTLQFIGTGYNAVLEGKWLKCNLGFSHEIFVQVPSHLKVEAGKPKTSSILKVNIEVLISGINKEEVGKFAAVVRKLRPPENYKGKGIRYLGEYVKIKQGKTAE